MSINYFSNICQIDIHSDFELDLHFVLETTIFANSDCAVGICVPHPSRSLNIAAPSESRKNVNARTAAGTMVFYLDPDGAAMFGERKG